MATMTMAERATVGMCDNGTVSVSSASPMRMPVARLAKAVRAPAVAFTAVREKLPVTGKPAPSAHAKFPATCAHASCDEYTA
jgi:hypothetical protein